MSWWHSGNRCRLPGDYRAVVYGILKTFHQQSSENLQKVQMKSRSSPVQFLKAITHLDFDGSDHQLVL